MEHHKYKAGNHGEAGEPAERGSEALFVDACGRAVGEDLAERKSCGKAAAVCPVVDGDASIEAHGKKDDRGGNELGAELPRETSAAFRGDGEQDADQSPNRRAGGEKNGTRGSD